ncbi:MAG: glycosyltransferase family 4 protein [Paludibacteraceae bacterium]
MKIAFLFGSLNCGGTETLLLDVCRNLSKDDFDAIGVYRKEGILETAFVESDIPFFKLTSRKNKIVYLWKLRTLLNAQKVDIVHAQQPIDALYAKIACLFINKKIILTFHGFDFTSGNKLIKFIIKRTDCNIFVSEYQKNYYISKYKLTQQAQSVVYNGIDFSKLNLSDVRDASKTLKNELHLNSKDTLLLGMVGNFNDVRDQYTVCKFLKLLDEKGLDFRFVFVGKRIGQIPERYDRCVDFCNENQLNHKVSFLGIRNDVPEILSELDVFIYSTEHDTFGIAVAEAMAAGFWCW